ncbi:MAG: hypothetical protein CMM46_14425 [Rhodospirillaceae bacterium]|nr:hypothetical protein [Rhodospirillaceae bacterium]|tara:strand:+ start:7812 stop:8321 length:510 start_codon:yes stop_codon:yes gene_type:complete
MAGTPRNVLFLCTGNSARSVLSECLLERWSGGRFRAFSAGSKPLGAVNPHVLDLLECLGHPTDRLRSKSWNEFSGDGAPALDVVVTVCSNAAGENCPVWVGAPLTTHWGVEDPAAVKGDDDEIAEAFLETYRILETRIRHFVSLPLEELDQSALKRELDAIGEMPAASA